MARGVTRRGLSTSIFSSTSPPMLEDTVDVEPEDEPHEDNPLLLVVPLSLLSEEPSLKLPPCGLSILQSSKLLWCFKSSL